jgi:hypothetical protein
MTLVNETGQDVEYWINCDAVGPNCGDIAVDGLVDLPEYDNQLSVLVSFKPGGGALAFSINVPTTETDQQVSMVLVAE